MDNSHLEIILKIKAGQRLTPKERIEYLKNNLTYLKQSKERDIARDNILDAMAVNMAKLPDNAEITRRNEALSQYWQQVAIERQEFNDKFDKIMNELRNRDIDNSQPQ